MEKIGSSGSKPLGIGDQLPIISITGPLDDIHFPPPSLEQPFVEGSMDTAVGPVPIVSSHLTWSDEWGNIKARWGIGRMNHKVDPGLYALGSPDDKSPALVTANYKMSFDRLRGALPERNLWILVLDTDGVNVWCSAGKGAFGTEELIRRLKVSRIEELVSVNELILPQLSAPGVAAHMVKKLSGFRVTYGPILSKDLPEFLDSGKKATPAMRTKTFTVKERAVLIPVEIVTGAKWAILLAIIFFLFSGFTGDNGFWKNAFNHGIFSAAAIVWALMAGTVLTPLLLPILPGRAFSLKTLIPAFIGVITLILIRANYAGTAFGNLEAFAWIFLVPAFSAYLAMNFTGCSTYTSLSGVKKEMRWAVPMQIAAGVIGISLWTGSRFAL